MAKKNRDDFTEKTKLQIAKRAGWLCSYPSCRTPTVGATSDGRGEINIGTAAHICAAASGGPRYDPNMSPEERVSANNGIWMCRDHGKAIDSNDPEFTVKRLREWKKQAEQESWRCVLRSESSHVSTFASDSPLAQRLRVAADADLAVFRRTAKWPSTSVALTLKIEDHGESATTTALAIAVTTLDDLILVAAPGMGKTTTLFQIAEGVLANGSGTPLVVPLGDWASEDSSILDSILKRPAFRKISEDDFREVAAKPGVGIVLLLDGWNELDGGARERARVQVANLKAELPGLGLVVSTRRQALDVPFVGTRVNLLPLSEEQQINIAVAMHGEAGAKIVDQAWRTAGVRELVTIPLYLTALLSLPKNAPFPMTKEEVLRYFVAAHEREARRAEALRAVAQGFHQDYLEGLAIFATRTSNTAITDTNARRSISKTEDLLVANGQITVKPQPDAVLEVLISNHVLMRAGDTPGYSFQHQQFQEWYASHFVERRIMVEATDTVAREVLKAEVFNLPVFEEAILFTVERLARGDAFQQAVCGNAILAAFEVDPNLAAEMIYRSTDVVWARVSTTIQALVRRWHTPGKVDRAVRFMISSGRPEFFDQVWPLITHEDDQVHLRALRAGRRFRPSLLGSDAAKRIGALSVEIRQSILREIASNSGMDGLDLAASVAKADPDPEVKAAVIDALAFRRADRHVAAVLREGDDETFDLVASKGLLDDVKDEDLKAGLAAARKRLSKERIPHAEQMRSLVYGRGDDDCSAELATVIAEMEIGDKKNGAVNLIYEAEKRFPRAVAAGVLCRVRDGHTLPFHASELIANGGFAFEDDALLSIALGDDDFDDRSISAASALGPQAVGCLIEKLFEAKELIRGAEGKYDEVARKRYYAIQDRIGHTQIASLLAAIAARSEQSDNREMGELSDLISRHPHGENYRSRPFDAAALAAIAGFAEDWGNRLLRSPNATRVQLVSIATLASRSPSARLLPILKRLLDEDLRRVRTFKEQARAEHYRGGIATSEARTSWALQYQRAFFAINCPETAALMRDYLLDEEFGICAARVLAGQWRAANEPSDDNRWKSWPDFSCVAEKRAARASDPGASSAEADAILDAIERLIADDATETMKKHAVALTTVAVALPHGQRDGTIGNLLALAERNSRGLLLTSLVLSGEIINVEMVKQGIADVFEAGQKQTWILADGCELKSWLRILPFTNSPGEAFDIVRALPEQYRTPDALEEMIDASGFAPGDDAENVLFKLAEADPGLYTHRAWPDAVIRRGTLSAATRFVDLAFQGVLSGKHGIDVWHLSTRIAELIGAYAELRSHVYDLLRNGPTSSGFGLLARAMAEHPDADGLILLIHLEIERKVPRSFTSWRTIENVVTEHVPAEDWKGAYDVLAVPAIEPRRRLLAMTTDGGPTDVAARYLNMIDEIRDEYGTPASEPRHPDLASGRPWPILTFDSDVETAE